MTGGEIYLLDYGGRLLLPWRATFCGPGVLRTATRRQSEVLERSMRQGKSVVVLATEHHMVAVFGVADTVRETSRSAIADLHALGVRTVMLSGDNQQTATAIAEQVGIDDACGSLLPEEKLVAVKDLIGEYGQVGMAGDGINDAPALAVADIGFAMGVAGSDTALETADVALMDDDLRKLPAFIRLSRRTAVILTENISLALGIKAVFLGLAVAGKDTLWMAILADMGVSLLVVFNGLRLLRVNTPLSSGSEVGPSPRRLPAEASPQ
jgi:Zn2+/Cd2+-exporting ATPase